MDHYCPENPMQQPIDPLVATLVDRLNDNLREAFEEQAGILEFDAQLARAHAECLALLRMSWSVIPKPHKRCSTEQ